MGKGMKVLPPEAYLGENEGMTLVGREDLYGDDGGER